MSTLREIAHNIAGRGRAFGWKPGTKKADELNMEAWVGALCGLQIAQHPDLSHVHSYVAMVIAVRGYSETLVLAAKHKEALEAAEVAPAA